MLISCKVYGAQPISEQDFNVFLQRVEIVNNTNPKAALIQLNTYQDDIGLYTLNSQINFYRIQSEAYSDQGLYSLSSESADLGLSLAKQMTNPTIYIAELAYTKGFALESLGELAPAIEFYQHGLDVSRSMSHKEFIAKGLINIGAIHYLRKQYKRSLITLNQALEIANTLNNEPLMGDITSELGILYGYIGEEAHANDYFQQSYQHYKNAGKHTYALNSLHNVAINHSNQQRYEEAISVYRVLESEIRESTPNEFIFGIYRSLAWALVNKEDADIENGYRYIMLAGEYVKEIEQQQLKLQYVVDKAFALNKMKRYDEALTTVEQARNLLRDKSGILYKQSEMEVLYLSAALHFRLENYEKAFEIQKKFFEKKVIMEQANETSEIDELRLQYESEQAARKKDILEKKQSLQNYQLTQAENKARNRDILIAGLAVFILILAWGLHKAVKRQKRVTGVNRASELLGIQAVPDIKKLAQVQFERAKYDVDIVSLCLIRIDFFDDIISKHGYRIADVFIQNIKELADQYMRGEDKFNYLHKGVFILFLPSIDKQCATDISERLQHNIDTAYWKIGGLEPLEMSVAITEIALTLQPNFDDVWQQLYAQFNEPIASKKEIGNA